MTLNMVMNPKQSVPKSLSRLNVFVVGGRYVRLHVI